MPYRPRRRRKLERFAIEQLSISNRLDLLLGHYGPGTGFTTIDELREAWETNRNEMMRLLAPGERGQCCRGCRAGERPECWWLFEAQEPRRFVKASNGDKVFEPQVDYLRRLGLLTPEEIAMLRAQAKAKKSGPATQEDEEAEDG